MYILRAFCALTIASLCTDVEAHWYGIGHRYEYISFTSWKKADEVMKFDENYEDRKYTSTETLYFKVICDSPVTINKIEVDVKSGKFLLSANSAKSNICSDQTSECPKRLNSVAQYASKQIQEKEFFIEVKPNPEFTGGQLKLELKQAGKIYMINHEGARFFNQKAVRLYSGYHPVKYPEKLPQYKITCNGNCKIQQIWGFGSNFEIALARHPYCTDCHCTLKREGNRVDCQKDGSFVSFDRFNMDSWFYIALVPRGEVLDAEVTITGANFESVTKGGYATNKVLRFDNRKYTGTETIYFKVICDSSPVTINKIKVEGFSGNLLLSAKSATSNICSGQTSECLGTTQILENDFFIYVKPNPDFTGGELTLELEQEGDIFEINHEGARYFNRNKIRLYSGYHPVGYPERLPQYKIFCYGTCGEIKIWGFGNNFEIALAINVPVKSGKDGCKNCICTSIRNGNKVSCQKKGFYQNWYKSFTSWSRYLYITLDPRGKGKVIDAEVTLEGSNILSVTKAGYAVQVCDPPGTLKTGKGGICTCKPDYTGRYCEKCSGPRCCSSDETYACKCFKS